MTDIFIFKALSFDFLILLTGIIYTVMANRPKQQLTPLDIPAVEICLKTICEHFNATREELLSNSRKQPLPEARKMAAWTMVNLANVDQKTAAYVLQKSEANISQYITGITAQMDVNKNYRRACLAISDLVMAKLNIQLGEEYLIRLVYNLGVRVNTAERYVSVSYFHRDEILNNAWFVYLTAKFKYNVQLSFEDTPRAAAV